MSAVKFRRKGGVGATMGVVPLLLFSLFWCSLTGVFVGFVGVTAYRVADANLRFQTTEGMVTASRVVTSRGSKGSTSYTPVVDYRYTVAGREYHSDRYEFMSGGSSASGGARGATAVVERCRPGTKVTVFYDPQRPDSAVLSRSLPDMLVFLALFLQPFVLVGLGMLTATVLAGRELLRGRAFRLGRAQRPPWPVPGWGVLQREPGGALCLRGDGRTVAAAMAFAIGYGATCFLSIFVIAIGFLAILGGKYGVVIPVLVAFAVALGVGAYAARRTWGKGDPSVSFSFHPARGKLTLSGGEHQEPVNLRLDEVAGVLTRWEWRTLSPRNGNRRRRVSLVKLVTVDGRELALTGLDTREDADHLVAELAALLGKPVVPTTEPDAPEVDLSPPASLGEAFAMIRDQAKKARDARK